MEHKRGENGAAGRRKLRRPFHKRSTRSKAGRGEEDEGGNTCPSGGIIWVIVISILLVATLSVFNILALSDKPGGVPHQHNLGFLAAVTREPEIPWRGKLPPLSPTAAGAPAAGAQGQLPPAGVAATSAQVQQAAATAPQSSAAAAWPPLAHNAVAPAPAPLPGSHVVQAPMLGSPAGRGATACFEGDLLMHVTTDADAEEVTFGGWIYLPQVPEASFPASSGSMKTIASTKVSGCELKDELTDGWSFWVHEWGTTNRQLRLSWTSGAEACHELFSRADLVPFDKWVLVGFTLSKAQNRAQIFLEGHLIADTTQGKGEFATAGKPLPLERADVASRVIRARGGKADLYLGAHPAQHKDSTGQSSHAFIGFLGDVRLLHTAMGADETPRLLALKPEELLSSGLVAPSAVVLQIQFELGQGPRNSVDSGSLAARKVTSLHDDPNAIHLTAFAEQLRHHILGVAEAPAPPVEIPVAPAGSTLDPDALRATWPEEWTKAFSSEVLLQSQREADPWADEVRDAMRHTWAGYRQQAWGHDEVKPVSGRPNDWCKLAITMLDGLSTLWVMGLHKEFDDAERWLQENPLPSEGKHGMHSLFEINIRAVGGLLSAHSLSGRSTFLEAARKLVDRILPAFNTPHGMPHGAVDVGTGEFGQHPWQKGKNVKTILAEPTTVQLEYRYLSHVTGDAKYAGVADRAENAVLGAAGSRGVVPIYLSSVTQSSQPTFVGTKLSFGGMGDSYYEYLLKQWVQTGRKEHRFLDAWKNSIRGMMEQLVMKTNGGLTFVGEKDGTRQKAKMDHLTCFVAGMLMLGSRTLPKDEVNPEWEPLAAQLARTCYEMYKRSPTGLAPEYVDFKQNQGEGQDMSIPHNAAYNILRPEAIEALYYMHYYTGDPKYRRWAHEMFSAFQKHCRAPFGYSALADVRKGTPSKRDSQESFWLAETLKYFYLIFSPRSTLSLEEFVLNTEAHPLKIWS